MLPVTGNNLMIGSLLYVHLSPLYGTWYHEHNNLQKNVHETTEFLEMFLRNLLLGEKHELHNRTMHISGSFHEDAKKLTH